jgi:hypothetical protein
MYSQQLLPSWKWRWRIRSDSTGKPKGNCTRWTWLQWPGGRRVSWKKVENDGTKMAGIGVVLIEWSQGSV